MDAHQIGGSDEEVDFRRAADLGLVIKNGEVHNNEKVVFMLIYLGPFYLAEAVFQFQWMEGVMGAKVLHILRRGPDDIDPS